MPAEVFSFKVGKPLRRGSTWQEKIRRAAEIVAKMHVALGSDMSAARRKTIEAARDALGPRPGADMLTTMVISRGDGRGAEPEEVMEPAGVFRLVLIDVPVDWSDPRTQERAMIEIARELDRLGIA